MVSSSSRAWVTDPGGHPDGSRGPDDSGGGQAADRNLILKDDAGTDKANSGDDIGGDPVVGAHAVP